MNPKYPARQSCFIVAFAFGILIQSAAAQSIEANTSTDTTRSSFSRKDVITYGIVAHSIFTTYVEYQWWWKGDYHPFNIKMEGFLNDYTYGVDKFGHVYTSHFYFTALHNIMRWGGYDESTNLWVSTLIPAIYALSIEIGDGFSSYIFSPDDLGFNLLGIGYGLLQAKYPFFYNFKIKWSYIPSDGHLNTFKHPFSDDYDGHIYWLSVNVHNLLPESMQSYWPRFLNVAVGYGGNDITRAGQEALRTPVRKYAISLDYNLTLLPLEGDTWEVVKNIVDLFHLPAPGVRFIGSDKGEFKPILLH